MLQPIVKQIRIKSTIKSFISRKYPPRQIPATGGVTIELKFYPDNEEDNYTNAVMGINAEFLKEFNGSTTQETTQETTTKTTTKTTMKKYPPRQISATGGAISGKHKEA